ncbi:YqiA/YcfP family alpha/beta fold hydrolase [Psychrobacter sp. M13]|uniref:YqiA/YcfP family alpha/beta fold hydrolase n=1 Tax=Psychrobacter sp. M13 TaxID=3067275 RepID=UPI00273AA400|nr:YqiA/YcfP family alpha/beta fold hydrolase [Psychrobacter sp. M13]WLP94018.1 YqiA/YcfP family alpha/beta fold hydrolase [Psychrobacter sp. M13]
MMTHSIDSNNSVASGQTLLLFFHGLDSSAETNKFTCIEHQLKYCLTVNYRQGFEKALKVYDELIQQKMLEYPRIVLAGHSLGGWFANHFAHKYNLRILLIAPCINPNVVLFNRAPDANDLPFLTSNKQLTKVMVEVSDEILSVETAKRVLVDLPASWEVVYFTGGHHRIARSKQINESIDILCADNGSL